MAPIPAPCRALLRLAPAVALAACAGSAASDDPLALTAVEPLAASFRETTEITLKGSGLDPGLVVHFGDVEGRVVSASGSTARIEVPPGGGARRVALHVTRGEATATFEKPFVFRAMAPEDLRFVAGPALPLVPDALALGDLDGDGRADLAAATAESVTFLSLASDGPKQLAASAPGAHAVAVFGHAVVAAGDTLDLLTLKDGAIARVAAKFGGNPVALAVAGPELYAVVRSDQSFTLGRLAGTAESPELEKLVNLGTYAVASLAAGDVDGDGATDVVLGGVTDGTRVLLGDGHGAFREAPAGLLPGLVAGAARFADLDADGAADLVIAASGGDRAWRNVGGRFVDRTAAIFGRTDARADFEADLDGDAAVDRVGGAGLELLRNDGEGRFYDYTQKSAAPFRDATPLFSGDFDDDGDLDLVVRDASGARILVNWAPKAWADEDGDGVADEADDCPKKADPDQANRDRNHFACTDPGCAAEPGCRLVTGPAKAYLVCGNALNFAAAQAFCRVRGAGLALGNDADEAALIGSSIGTSGWVDLTDAGHEGHFTRADGSDPAFAAWHPGEPNNSGGNENCAETDTAGGLNDVPCDITRAFACEEHLARQGDVFGDACDVCPFVADADQLDSNGNGTGDACEAAP